MMASSNQAAAAAAAAAAAVAAEEEEGGDHHENPALGLGGGQEDREGLLEQEAEALLELTDEELAVGAPGNARLVELLAGFAALEMPGPAIVAVVQVRSQHELLPSRIGSGACRSFANCVPLGPEDTGCLRPCSLWVSAATGWTPLAPGAMFRRWGGG